MSRRSKNLEQQILLSSELEDLLYGSFQISRLNYIPGYNDVEPSCEWIEFSLLSIDHSIVLLQLQGKEDISFGNITFHPWFEKGYFEDRLRFYAFSELPGWRLRLDLYELYTTSGELEIVGDIRKNEAQHYYDSWELVGEIRDFKLKNLE